MVADSVKDIIETFERLIKRGEKKINECNAMLETWDLKEEEKKEIKKWIIEYEKDIKKFKESIDEFKRKW